MARQKKTVTDKTEDQGKVNLSIVSNNGKFIVMYGGSVRQVFLTRAKAEEYLKMAGK